MVFLFNRICIHLENSPFTCVNDRIINKEIGQVLNNNGLKRGMYET